MVGELHERVRVIGSLKTWALRNGYQSVFSEIFLVFQNAYAQILVFKALQINF